MLHVDFSGLHTG